MPKEEVRWSCVTVNEDLLVFPHSWLFAPAVAQRGELLGLGPGNELLLGELAHEAVEVGTIFVKIHPIAVRRPVMKGGQEIREGGELSIEPVWLSRKNSVCDDTAQRLSSIVFLNQKAVQPAIVDQGTYDFMRVSDQSITAHEMLLVNFLLNTLICLWHMGTTMAIPCKELSYHLHLAILLFIHVHFIAPAHTKDAKCSMMII